MLQCTTGEQATDKPQKPRTPGFTADGANNRKPSKDETHEPADVISTPLPPNATPVAVRPSVTLPSQKPITNKLAVSLGCSLRSILLESFIPSPPPDTPATSTATSQEAQSTTTCPIRLFLPLPPGQRRSFRQLWRHSRFLVRGEKHALQGIRTVWWRSLVVGFCEQ